MSLVKTVKQVAQSIGGAKTHHICMRTTYCRPATQRDRDTGIETECSRTIRAGSVEPVPTDSDEFNELIRRGYAYVVTEGRDEKGNKIWIGAEPTEPPQMDPPIHSTPDPNAAESQQLGLLHRLVDALEKNGVGAVAKGSAA